MTLALAAWRWLPRPLAVGTLALAVAIALATVYTQNHYAIDAVAGIVLAGFLQTIVAPVLTGEVQRTSAARRRVAIATLD
jgi:membrane-associated phospholipid phosphatase